MYGVPILEVSIKFTINTVYDRLPLFPCPLCSSDAGPRSAVMGQLSRPCQSARKAMSDTEGSRVRVHTNHIVHAFKKKKMCSTV